MKIFNALNSVMLGDCVQLMAGLPSESVDFILDRSALSDELSRPLGRTVTNDDNDRWLNPHSRKCTAS